MKKLCKNNNLCKFFNFSWKHVCWKIIDISLLLTSAAIKAKVLKDIKKNAAAVHTRSIKEDTARIAANNPRSRAWLHPGVVGENDNWNKKFGYCILWYNLDIFESIVNF